MSSIVFGGFSFLYVYRALNYTLHQRAANHLYSCALYHPSQIEQGKANDMSHAMIDSTNAATPAVWLNWQLRMHYVVSLTDESAFA